MKKINWKSKNAIRFCTIKRIKTVDGGRWTANGLRYTADGKNRPPFVVKKIVHRLSFTVKKKHSLFVYTELVYLRFLNFFDEGNFREQSPPTQIICGGRFFLRSEGVGKRSQEWGRGNSLFSFLFSVV